MTDSRRNEQQYSVVAPTGRPGGLPATAMAPRLDDLSGRRIGFVWDHIFRGDDMFAQFRAAAAERFPGVEFVGHEVFGNIHGTSTEEQQVVADLPERLRAERIDAVVVGVGA
jgi:hypothetical protein